MSARRTDTIVVRKSETIKSEVETVSSDVVEAMLRDALSHDRELLIPFLVLGSFCGLRPDGELLKVRWSDICLEGTPQLTVRAEIAKTAQRRFIDLQPNAIEFEWLKLCEGERGGQILSLPLM